MPDFLPAIIANEQDGNLLGSTINDNPVVLVMGTAGQGPSETEHTVARVSESARTFGKEGSLTRGLYEASIGGAKNIRLFRIGATSARLNYVGTGITIETVAKDDSAGTDYSLFWDDTAKRLRVYRESDGELVYDNNPTYPLQAIDLHEVVVSGTATGSPGDIGTLGVPPTLYGAHTIAGAFFTAGTDGIDLSRMKLYEAFHDAYQLLENSLMDVVVPMNVYLDDANVMDMSASGVTTLGLTTLLTYPAAGDDDDVLGKLYTEEFEGKNYYWWWFPADPVTPVFGGAQLFPVAGLAGSNQATDGTVLTADDFHEVNFGYQLANFCYVQSRDNAHMNGVVGVLPPASYAPKDISQWVGSLPTTTEDANGNVVVSVNGVGLLGNKFMSGRAALGGKSAFTVDGIAGLFNGGFIATDTGWLDDTQQEDDNEHLIDIGKYVSVVATYPLLSNPSQSGSYAATGAATYGGFYSDLPVNSAPSNKLLKSMRLPFRINGSKLDLMAGQRYVTFHEKPRGIVVSDSPTAARPDSDYQRLSTVRQVKAVIDAIRRVGDRFLGEGLTGARIAALDTAIDSQLKSLVKAGLINRYEHTIISTAQQRVLGEATVELKLVPAFELRKITVVVALAAV